MAQWRNMVTKIWINIGSGNGLVPDGTKQLPEPMLILISEVLWHSPDNNSTVCTEAIILYNEF